MKVNGKLKYTLIIIVSILVLLFYTKPSDTEMKAQFKINWDKNELRMFDYRTENYYLLMNTNLAKIKADPNRPNTGTNRFINYYMKVDEQTRISFLQNTEVKDYILWKYMNWNDYFIGIGILGQYIQIK
jgi:hypothetical protein